jgi:hypothetical protein
MGVNDWGLRLLGSEARRVSTSNVMKDRGETRRNEKRSEAGTEGDGRAFFFFGDRDRRGWGKERVWEGCMAGEVGK